MSEFVFVLHGGEPLMAGTKYVAEFCQSAAATLLPDIKPIFFIQTNGILIDENWCHLFGKLGINVGVSIDGAQEYHDKYRVDHQGKGTYLRVVEGLRNLMQHNSKQKFTVAALSVINLNSRPLEFYLHFKDLGLKRFEILLPDKNYDHNAAMSPGEKPGAYGDWLIELFDLWYSDSSSDRPQIRMFSNIVTSILGGNFQSDNLGSSDNEILVVETNGSIEAVDTLKICGENFTISGANVCSHSVDDALQTPLAKLYHQSGKELCYECQVCPVNSICGGGFIPHRYSSKNGFDNPSIYCEDLFKLICHIQSKIIGSLPDHTKEILDVVPLNYEVERNKRRELVHRDLDVVANHKLRFFGVEQLSIK